MTSEQLIEQFWARLYARLTTAIDLDDTTELGIERVNILLSIYWDFLALRENLTEEKKIEHTSHGGTENATE